MGGAGGCGQEGKRGVSSGRCGWAQRSRRWRGGREAWEGETVEGGVGGWEGPGGEAVGDCLLEGVGAIVEGGDNAVPVEEKGVVEWGVEKVVRKVS